MIKWGILSTAKIATEQIIPAITESKNSIIRGIASRDIKKAKKISKQFDIPKFFGTYDELLNYKKTFFVHACPDPARSDCPTILKQKNMFHFFDFF